jgi:hypothetical protein
MPLHPSLIAAGLAVLVNVAYFLFPGPPILFPVCFFSFYLFHFLFPNRLET